jgi:hypothetical protein
VVARRRCCCSCRRCGCHYGQGGGTGPGLARCSEISLEGGTERALASLCLCPGTVVYFYIFPLVLAVRLGYGAGAGFVGGAGISYRGARPPGGRVRIYHGRTGGGDACAGGFNISGAYVGSGIIRAVDWTYRGRGRAAYCTGRVFCPLVCVFCPLVMCLSVGVCLFTVDSY